MKIKTHVIPVNDLSVVVENHEGYQDLKIHAIVFQSDEDGEVKIKGVTINELREGSIEFDSGNYDFINGYKLITISK